MPSPLVVIPARLASTRLPGKPLADIHGIPMIVHVWRRAMEADIGPVVVACADAAIAWAVETAGGRAIMTDPALPSGSDRAHAAAEAVDPAGAHDFVLVVQGDVPTVDPASIRTLWEVLRSGDADVATLVTEVTGAAERDNPNVVKAVVEFVPGTRHGRALYFSRLPVPWGDGPHWHHIGLYGYRRAALRRFVAMPPATLETREKLEQLRALAAGMTIAVAAVDTVPLGVDTQEDLERARALLAPAT